MPKSLKKDKKEISTFKKFDDLSDFAVKKWKSLSKEAIKKRGRFVVALSGGRTPVGFYKKLAASKAGLWDKTHIFLADERFVPESDPYSNLRTIKKNLINKVPIPAENIHLVEVGDSCEASASHYQKDIKDFFKLKKGEFPSFDLVILGIGADGHTASLFPSDSAIRKKSLAAAVSIGEVKCERITLTLPVINNAKNIIFMVTGDNKGRVVKNVLCAHSQKLPASLVETNKGNVFFLLDKAAASYL